MVGFLSSAQRGSKHTPHESPELVIVLGMHRSGTSVIAHILSQAGFFVGEEDELIPGGKWNRNGYFERKSVVHANDGILALCEGSWLCPPPEDRVLNLNLNQTIVSLLTQYQGHPRSLIKDPRLCLTLPVWERVLPADIRIVMISRHPDAVAASLSTRFGFSLEIGRRLWVMYMDRAHRYAIRYPVYSLHYEDLFSSQRKRILKEVAGFLGVAADLEDIGRNTIDPALRHHENNTTARCMMGHECSQSV